MNLMKVRIENTGKKTKLLSAKRGRVENKLSTWIYNEITI
jgi:hypothetical protein